MSCKYINNNRESLIYDQLVKKYGDERALNILKSFETESFIQDFGDYVDLMQNPTDLIPSEFKGRINEYFEPLLLEDETGLYYLDKTFSKQYIDVSESKLNRLFSSQRAVNSLVELTASNFINDRGLTLMSDELEFLSDKNNISLKESLKNYLFILGGNLLESPNDDHFVNGVALGNILEDDATLDELQGRVVDYLKARKIQYAEELNEEEVDLLEEEVRDFNFSKASFEINTKSKVRANVKLILSLIKDPTTIEPDFRQSLPIDYTSLYNKLTNLLKDNPVTLEEVNGELKIEDLFSTYIDILKSNVDNIQYLSPLIEFLEKINNLNDDISKKEGLKVFTFKAGFVQAFNLHKNYFNTKEASSIEVEITPEVKATKMHPDGFPIQVTVKNAVKGPQPVYNQFDASKDTSTRKDLLNSWKLSILDKFGLNENNKVISEESKDKINKLKIKADLLIKDRKLSLKEKVDSFLNDILPSMGLNISKDEYIFGINKLSNQSLSESEYNNRQLEFIEEFNYILQHLIKNFNESRDLYPTNHRIINNIIDSILYFRLDGSESSTYTGNKTKYNYSNPSYLHNVINSWKKNRDILQREYDNREVWSKNSKLYEYLLALDVEEENRRQVSESRINEFEIIHFNSFKDKDVKNSTHKDNRVITKAEYIKDTVNGLLFSRKGKNYSTYGRTTTAPGKSTQFEMKHSMFVDSELVYFNGEYDLTTFIDHFMYYLNAEFERMRDEYEYIKNNKNKLDVYYHTNVNGDLYDKNKLIGNAFKSQLFPSLSFDQINKHLNINPKAPLYNADGSINFENVAYYEEDIRKHIENVIKEKLNELKQDLINYNILEISEENIYRNKGIDGDILKTYSPSGVFISETNLQKLLGDLLLNGTVSHIEYSKLFSGDIAYYKNPVDYIKRIGASYSDGIYEYLSEKTKNFKISVINSVEIVTHYLDELKQVIKSDENLMKAWTDVVNSADAQAWITPQRWMNLLVGTSKFTEKHRVVYNKLINNELLSEDELKIAAQPLKGTYFQRDSKGKPIFLKYSQAVLIPQLTANSSLKELSKLMEANKVDELVTFDAIKAGSLIPTTIHDENGNPTIYEEDGSVKKLNVMTLDSRGWKLQQDLPTKGFKELPIGTQLLRNMLLLLSDKIKSKEKTFEHNGETYTTEEYAKLIDDTLGNLIRNNYEGLLKEFNIDSEGSINNIEVFYNTLADELVSREISDELVKALRAKLSIFAFPGLKSKLDNIFSSIVKKRTVDIKTNGGAFIQMSNFGLSKQEADSKYGEGIKWHPSVEKNGTTRPYRYKLDENGEVVKNIFGDPVIEPEQILLSGSFIAKYIPDYQKYDPKELFKIIDEKILNNIIGYRIPNQGPSSNGALQVVGILPASVGDTIVAFTGITKKTGSDFDIDKMYVMFPNYTPKFKEKSKLYKYFKNVLRDRNDIEKTIENIENILDQIKTDVKNEIDVEGFAEELLNLDISDINSFEVDTENYYKDLFVEAILNAESSPLVDYIKEQAGLNEVSSLEYVDSNLPSRKGYQNKLIELYKGLILHPSNIGKIMTPLDHDFIKMDAQNLAPAKEKGDVDNFEFIQDILTKYSFLAGLTGVGQEANTSSDYAMGTMSDIYYENVTLLDRGHKGKTLSLEITNKDGETKFIDVEHTKFDEIDSIPLKDEEIKQWVDSYNSRVNEKDKKSFEEIKKLYQSIPISNSITALMNAFVDIAKDPYITNINWNTLTTNTGNMLIRGGVHPFVVTSFLAQPIITEYVDFVASYETENKNNQKLQSKDAFRVFKISEKFKNDLITVGQFEDGSITTINAGELYKIVAEKEFDLNNLSVKSFVRKNILTEVVKRLGLPNTQSITERDIDDIQKQVKDIVKTHGIYFKESESFTDFTINKSLKEIRENVFKTTDNFQSNVFNTFLKFQGYGKKVSAGVMASKFGIKGYGKNSVALLASINKLEDVRNKGVMFYNTKFFYPDGTPKMLQHFKTYHLDASQKIMQNNPLLFVSSTPFVWNTYNLISKDIYGTKMEDDESNGLGDNLEKSFYTYLLSGFEPFNLTNEEKENLIKNFYSEFVNTKNKLANEKYYILEQLQVRTKGEHKYIGITNKTNSKEYTDKMINSWREVIKHHPEFGKKLVQYSFLTSGFNPHTTSFYQFIPPSFFFQNNFNQYVKNYTGRYENDNVDLNFVDHFYLANLNNSKFVKFVHPSNVNTEATKKYGLGIKVLPNSISYRYINMDKTFYKNIGVDVNGNNLYSPYVKVKDGYAKIKPIVSEIDLGYKVFNFSSDVVDLPNGVSKEAIEYFNAIEDSVNPNTSVKLVEDMEGDITEVENNVEVNRDYTETETTSTTSEYEDLGFGQERNLSEKEKLQKLASLNKGKSVSVKYDKYKTSFNAIITGEIEEVSSPTKLEYDDGRVEYKDDGVYRLQIKSSTGKLLTADTSEITGLSELINPEITPQQNQQLDLFKDGIDPFNEAPNENEQNNCK